MKKRFKAKKRIKNKIILIFIILVIIYNLFNLYIKKIKLIESNDKLINNILSINYKYSYNDRLLESTSKYVNYNFNNPVELLKKNLNYKGEIKKTVFDESISDEPIVFLYNSHQGETYSTGYLEDYNIIPTIIVASYILEEKLEKLGINTLVLEENILEYMKNKNLDHSGSYIASRFFLENIVNKYNSIKLFIDIHRDAATHEVTYTKINNKNCAKVLFVIGLSNPNFNKNLENTNTINNLILSKYPSLTRGIMKKQGINVNGIYNQDLNENIILLEVGGNENNIEEVNNTLELIAHIIKEYLDEKK